MSNSQEMIQEGTPEGVARPATASTGASKAYKKPAVGPKPNLTQLSKTTNGALLAASRSWAANSANHSSGKSVAETLTSSRNKVFSVPHVSPRTEEKRILSSTAIQEPSHRDASSRLRDEFARSKAREANLAKLVSKPPIPAPRRNGATIPDAPKVEASDMAQRAISQAAQPALVKDIASIRKPSLSPQRAERYRDQSIRMLSPHVTGESLSNAIVGAHLALSRSPSRQLSPVRSPPGGRSKSRQRKAISRTTSPRKAPVPMRATMRSSDSSESSEGGHHRRPKRHPHKHHEGERKKWRDRITDEETKRIAGWWAANRGLYVPPVCPVSQGSSLTQSEIEASYKPEEEVVNVVVRELWKRSRLPDHNLSDIWNLVDDRRIGSLSKEQFIVGVWLIDQKLKGHKLPRTMGQSVWQSVRRHNGIDVKIRVP